MAKENFAACLAQVLLSEGGWSDHPADPGGATMKGITLATYRKYRPGATKADLRAIADAEVAQIYREGYWNAVRGDDLPAGLDLVAFDAAVNSGTGRAAKWLQSAVGAVADGRIGAGTAAAAHAARLPDAIRRALQAGPLRVRGRLSDRAGRVSVAKIFHAAVLHALDDGLPVPDVLDKGPATHGMLVDHGQPCRVHRGLRPF